VDAEDHMGEVKGNVHDNMAACTSMMRQMSFAVLEELHALLTR